ncbi:uncharacterized protein VP01_8301g2 [Puccinia sorghi]|uniref:Uncharacterized protein n=1 Tax=Puccinia sorghi TaxID=27349 RepID=A0A0L6U9P6_9BASI|nr:uncharacterized protein VP01_8301g2 [Puccinia sorghi]
MAFVGGWRQMTSMEDMFGICSSRNMRQTTTFPHCQKPLKICSHCQKTGHTADSFYQKHPEKQPSKDSPAPQAHFAISSKEDDQAQFLSL